MADEQQQAGGQNAGAGEAAVRRIQLPIAKPFDGKPGESRPKWRQCFEHRLRRNKTGEHFSVFCGGHRR